MSACEHGGRGPVLAVLQVPASQGQNVPRIQRATEPGKPVGSQAVTKEIKNEQPHKTTAIPVVYCCSWQTETRAKGKDG